MSLTSFQVNSEYQTQLIVEGDQAVPVTQRVLQGGTEGRLPFQDHLNQAVAMCSDDEAMGAIITK